MAKREELTAGDGFYGMIANVHCERGKLIQIVVEQCHELFELTQELGE